MVEHRRLPRWEINSPGSLKLEPAKVIGQPAAVWPQLAKSTEGVACQIKDINYKGVKISLSTKLPLSTALRINLRLSENYTIDAEIWVAWHKVINGANHYGLYFNSIKDVDKEKIFEFISVFYPQELKQKFWPGVSKIEEEEGGEDMNDHRIFERFKREFSARFIGLEGKEGLAQTFDVSAKGLGLFTSQELESQANLEIWLNVPHSTDPLYTRGQVVWSRPAPTTGYHSGIELERADLMGISRLLRA